MGRRRGKIKRDALGRFASTGGGAAAGAAAGAAIGGALGSKTARSRLVAGSVKSESFVGTSKDGFTGAKVGARYNAPGGRQVVVKAIVGVSKPKTAPKKKPRAKTATKKTTGTRVRTR
ncbi:hypothetical protein [Rhodococcoides fascians]|uniref:hypothetical protein n=1 Tax=Rhodococcoides fascians TaxID=1828 RepID=UPI0006909A03|nr:hypothetical protein [Rhodococcus fascians]